MPVRSMILTLATVCALSAAPVSSWHAPAMMAGPRSLLDAETVAVFATPSTIQADEPPTILVENVLVPNDASQAAQFGSVVAISGDVLVTAAPSLNVGGHQTVGGAYVFIRDLVTGQWVERKKLVPPEGEDAWPMSVAVDGDTVAVGTPNADIRQGFQQGAVYIYGRHQGGTDNWGAVTKLSDTGVGDLGHFGTSLAFSGDLLLVGATMPPSMGLVEVFERNRGGTNAWGKVTNVSYNGDGGFSPEMFGVSLAIDGDLLLVGASSADVSWLASNDGAAYLFQRDAINRDTWVYLTRFTEPEAVVCTGGRTIIEMSFEPLEVREAWQQCAQGDTLTDNAGFGGNVALEGDTAMVTGRGAIYVFQQDASNAAQWDQVAKLQTADGNSFGRVALEGDTLLAGASGTDVDAKIDQGTVYVLQRDQTTQAWTEVEKLLAIDGLSEDHFGNALAIQGTTRIIGASGRNGDQGAIYVYEAVSEPPPPPPAGCQPAFPPTATLENAATIKSPSGFWLAALPDTLPEPLAVWIAEVDAPAEPNVGDPVSQAAYYNVGAQCTTFAPSTTPFVLGLPVPEGADTSRLAAAVLLSASSVHDGPASGRFWQPVTGTYDPLRRLYFIAVSTLDAAGTTVVLVEEPNPVPRPSLAARTSQNGEPTFQVKCWGRLDASMCDATQEGLFAGALLRAYRVYKGQHFPDPHLNDLNIQVAEELPGQQPVISLEHTANYTDIFIHARTDGLCGDRNGYYDQHTTGSIRLCLDEAGRFPSPKRLNDIARHELFHAVQFAYPKVYTDSDSWVLESTATAAENSDAGMNRDPSHDLRVVDVSLAVGRDSTPDTPPYPYQAQDFWVYLFRATQNGVPRDLPLGALGGFFERGASTDAVARYLRSAPNSMFDDLGGEYWRWVKNQVFEKEVTFGGKLTPPCTLNTDLAGPVLTLRYTDASEISDTIDGTLQAEVVAIAMLNAAPLSNVTVRAEGTGGRLAYKVYRVGESPCGSDIDDGERTFEEVPPNTVLHVVVANKDHRETGATLNYTISVVVPGPDGREMQR